MFCKRFKRDSKLKRKQKEVIEEARKKSMYGSGKDRHAYED